MHYPQISILMPVYKPSMKYLNLAVQSIRKQTYHNFELLVLYETFGSGYEEERIHNYFLSMNDPRIKVISIPKQTGLPGSLNIGIRSSEGEYIARMDADDYSLEHRLEKQLHYMSRHPETAVTGSSIRIMGSRTAAYGRNGMTPEIRAVRMMFKNTGVPHPTAFIRRSFLEEHHIWYNESIKGSEDYHLWVDIVRNRGRMEQVREPLLLYRVSESQASVRFSNEMIEWDNQAKFKLMDAVGDFDAKEHEILRDWFHSEIEYGADEYLDFIFRVIHYNKKSKVFDGKILEKELVLRYLMKGFSKYKYTGDASMLDKKRIRQIVNGSNYIYLLQKMPFEIFERIKINSEQ